MTEKKRRIEQLRDELADFMEEMTEENFDEERLNAILDELEKLDPTPPGTYKTAEESWKEFRETYAHLFEDTSAEGRNCEK